LRLVSVLGVLAGLAALAACNKSPRTAAPTRAPVPVALAPDARATPGAELGRLQGRVRLSHPPPESAKLKLDKDPEVCAGAFEESIVSQGVGLGNVVVTLVGSGHPQPAASPETHTVDQKGCRFVPHVLRVWAGDNVVVSNSDPILHNVHSYQGQGDDQEALDNIAQPAGMPPVEVSAPEKGHVTTLTCDVHPWMRGYVVFSPDQGVVTPATGEAGFGALPAGHYTIETWHEKLGTRRTEVDVRAGQTAEFTVEY
jgi:plastocyanin